MAFHNGHFPSPGSLANVMAEFDAAVRHLALSEDNVSFIREPRCSIKLKLPVRLDNGKIKVFKAYHTMHSIMRGPCIGGIQFRKSIDPEMVEALAFWSTHRCAMLGIPFGGSSGAIECDPSLYSGGELERISRRYLAELVSVVGPNNDILTSDMGSNQQIMCWFMDTYSTHRGNFIPAVVLGKPQDLGGAVCITNPAAIGAELCIRKACEHEGLSMEGATAAIQGFGKVGMSLALLLAEAGVRIVAIADISGSYFNEAGINIQEAMWHQQSYGILDGLESETDVLRLDDPMDIFELPVDILVPAAVELQITGRNASRVKARIIAEVAHDPVSPDADKLLYEKGVIVIPDILCNSGGVTGCYLEWVQNRLGYYWTAEEMTSELRQVVARAFDMVIEKSKEDSLPLRLAAAVIAVQRVAAASRLRGVYA